jgi:predicted metal-dependent hydrolase
MPEVTVHENAILAYSVRRSTRAKRVSITIEHDGRVTVTIPTRTRENIAESFVKEKARWIQKSRIKSAKLRSIPSMYGTAHAYRRYKEKAEWLLCKRVDHFNRHYRFHFNRVSVRNQRSCWGSCSAKRNLNFNYRLLFLPAPLLDYVVVHELCHLGALNHSKNFWHLVSQTLPAFKELERELKHYRIV